MGAGHGHVLVPLLVLSIITAACARNFVIVWEDDDIRKDNSDYGSNNGEEFSDMEDRKGLFGFVDSQESALEWDEFGDTEESTEDVLDPGSWIHILDYEDRDERPNEVSAFFLTSNFLFLCK